MKHVKGIKREELRLHEFKRLFQKKYLFERYYDGNAKELYELKMGSMTDDVYTNILLELVRYVPYLKEEKAKIQ